MVKYHLEVKVLNKKNQIKFILFLSITLIITLGAGVYRDAKIKERNRVLAEEIKKSELEEEERKRAENPLYKRVITFTGDSICYGEGFLGGYGKIIAENNSMIYKNLGKKGATIATGTFEEDGVTPRGYIVDTIKNMREDAEYVILEGGINDYWQNVPIGQVKEGFSEEFDITTFCGAMESMISQAKNKFSNAKIGYIITHKIPFTYTENNNDKRFNAYREKIIEICIKWDIPYLDLFEEVTLDINSDEIRQKYFYNEDGVHPNKEGYELFYVPKIEAWMKTL